MAESYCQPAVALVSVGDTILFYHEFDNPHAVDAIRAFSAERLTLGYLCRSAGLHSALLYEGSGYRAQVASLYICDTGIRRIIVAVELSGQPIGKISYYDAVAG